MLRRNRRKTHLTAKEFLMKVARECALTAAILFVYALTVLAQSPAQSVAAGKVTETVAVESQPGQSYAVFLPTNYSDTRPWPAVFCFDPRARGATAIKHFVPGAEKYGFIVLCSNNSRNGLDWANLIQIFTSLWKDAHQRFHIDEGRTYAAGFSGGARVATALAARCHGCIGGVIATGAGFPANSEPDDSLSFKYFGISGVDDFNFAEMWLLERKFSRLRVPYRFENFNGGHEWAPENVLEQALAWLTLQAMKDGQVPRDATFLETQLALRTEEAKGLLALQQYVAAERSLSSIERDFRSLLDLKAIDGLAGDIRHSDNFKKAVRTEDELIWRQSREAQEIGRLWTAPAEPDDAGLARHEAISRVREWRRKKDSTVDTDRRLARRILSQLLIGSFESAQAGLNGKNYSDALTNYQLAREIDPGNYNLTYEIARVFALKGERKSALQALKEAVSLGFKDLSRLKSEEAFASLQGEARFHSLITSISNQR
jgi:tetratricopeptide (TPR) repeat protein